MAELAACGELPDHAAAPRKFQVGVGQRVFRIACEDRRLQVQLEIRAFLRTAAGLVQRLDERARIDRDAAHRRPIEIARALQVDAHVVAGRQFGLREFDGQHIALRRKLDRAARGRTAGLECQIVDARRLLAMDDDEARATRTPGGFGETGDRVVESRARKIEVDVGVGLSVLEFRRELDADRAGDAHRLDAETRPRGVVERCVQRRERRLADILAQVERRRRAEDAAAAGGAQARGVADDRQRAILESFLADQFLRDEIRDIGVHEHLHVVAARVGTDLEVEPQLAVDLALERVGFERHGRDVADRLAREQFRDGVDGTRDAHVYAHRRRASAVVVRERKGAVRQRQLAAGPCLDGAGVRLEMNSAACEAPRSVEVRQVGHTLQRRDRGAAQLEFELE